jgi:hypothetical protein
MYNREVLPIRSSNTIAGCAASQPECYILRLAWAHTHKYNGPHRKQKEVTHIHYCGGED